MKTILKWNLVFHIAGRLVHHVNKIHQIQHSRGIQTAQFIEWRSQLRVTDQFTKRVQQSGARMSCNRGNKINIKQMLLNRSKSSPSIYLIDVRNTRIYSAYRDGHKWQFIFGDSFMFVYGFLSKFPFFVNNRKLRKDCTNSGCQSRFTHMVVIIH